MSIAEYSAAMGGVKTIETAKSGKSPSKLNQSDVKRLTEMLEKAKNK